MRNNNFVSASISSEGLDSATHSQSTSEYREESEIFAPAVREADTVAALAGEALEADLYVTDRPFLHQVSRDFADGVAICSARSALAVLGLYLRAQGEYAVSISENFKYVVSRGQYYLVGAREILPSSWRWLAACRQYRNGGGDDTPLILSWSLLDRVGRALQCRDEVHIAVARQPNKSAADEAVRSLDSLALWLMGALDASARVVHQLLGMSGEACGAGWQKRSWVAKLKKYAPDLAALVDTDSPGGTAVTILSSLRNSVHAEGAASVQARGRSPTLAGMLVRLPREDSEHLRQAFAELGGEAKWGVEFVADGRIYVDPALLLENVISPVLHLVDEIMQTTTSGQTCPVSIQDSDLAYPVNEEDPYAARNRQSVLWQLGY
jgi:hypothetical protein